MQLPFYQFLESTMTAAGLTDLLQSWQGQISVFFALLALACCFLGFSVSRPMLSGMTALAVIYCGMHWLVPAWGPLKAVTFCAVFSVSLAVVSFLCTRVNAMALCGAIAAGFLYSPLEPLVPLWALILILSLTAAAAAAVTFFFPLWSLCGFTALWGGSTFAFYGLHTLFPQISISGMTAAVILTAVLAAAGFFLQLLLYRHQTRFKEIMPAKLRYRLEMKKKGSAAVA